MKAGFYLGNHTYEVKEIKDRKPVDHEVKIEVAWCGLCGTDIHKFEGKKWSECCRTANYFRT